MENEKKTIICDIDGVLARYVAHYCARCFGIDVEQAYETYETQMTTWDALCTITGTTFEDLKRIQNEPGFVDGITLYPWARELFNTLEHMFGSVIFCTAVTHPDRVSWVERNFPGVPILSTEQKEILPRFGFRGVLLDDSGRNCDRFRNAGGIAVQFPSARTHSNFNADSSRLVSYVVQEIAKVW